jgi:hypothetical protein
VREVGPPNKKYEFPKYQEYANSENYITNSSKFIAKCLETFIVASLKLGGCGEVGPPNRKYEFPEKPRVCKF